MSADGAQDASQGGGIGGHERGVSARSVRRFLFPFRVRVCVLQQQQEAGAVRYPSTIQGRSGLQLLASRRPKRTVAAGGPRGCKPGWNDRSDQ